MAGYIGLVAVIAFIYLVFFRGDKKKKKKKAKDNKWMGPAIALVVLIALASGGKTIAPKILHHGGSSPSVQAAPGNPGGNVALGQRLAASYGWNTGAQWNCLYTLWDHESGWQIVWNTAGSGAYGIPQSLPADKMASAGADYMTNPATQIKWGLSYIQGRYGTPCGAWAVYCNHPGGPPGCWY